VSKSRDGVVSFPRINPAIGWKILEQIQAHSCVDLAAQMSFYFTLSLFPLFIVLAVVVGWLPSTTLWTSFVTWMVAYLPSDARRLVFSTILALGNGSSGFLSFGLAATLWSASSGFVSLMESLSIAYGNRDSRSFWRKHAIALCVTLLAVVFTIACFALLTFGRWGFEKTSLLPRYLPRPLWEVGRGTVTLALMCVGVSLVNFVLPDARRPWRWLTPGSAFVVLTLVASSLGLNLYIQHFYSFHRIYGALGGFIILMLWIYVASLILLIGAETDHEIEKLSN